jgi:hypothetical protein
MHPITYSMVLNLAVLSVLGFLAWAFTQPLLVLAYPLIAAHALERFNNQPPESEFEDEREPTIGFTADISK